MVAGTTIYVLFSAQDMYEAQRAGAALDSEAETINFLSQFGVSAKGLEILFDDASLSSSGLLKRSPPAKHKTNLGVSYLMSQLTPGQALDDLTNIALEYISNNLPYAYTPEQSMFTPRENLACQKVSLRQWTSQTIMEATTLALFGPALLRLEPTLISTFLHFEDLIWKMVYSIPLPWSNDMQAAKNRLCRAFMMYLELPTSQRTGEAWFVRTFEFEMRARGMHIDDIASSLLTVFWGCVCHL